MKRIAFQTGVTTSAPSIARSIGASTRFPSLPIAAFTATATERVRQDIVQPLALARPAHSCCQFQPPQPVLRSAAEDAGDVPGIDRACAPRWRRRHHLLLVAQARRRTRRATSKTTASAHCRITPVSMQPASRQSGSVHSRRRAGDRRHHRLWHGHQQTRRAVGRALRLAENTRGLLPGNPGARRTENLRRPGWPMACPTSCSSAG